MKKIFAVLAVCFAFAFSVSAQQITRFGVVDTSKVYEAYFKNSTPMRTYNTKKEEAQAEISKRADEIKKLKQQRKEAAELENTSEVESLDSQIEKMTQSLTDYTKLKNQELDKLKNSMQSNDLYKKLGRIIERVAEEEGFSMILSLQQGNGILWYSPSVDVTDKVIQKLGL